MVCQNCKAEVDNDLVFCTECGSRLHETVSNADAKTVVMSDSIITHETIVPPARKSNLKWVALIVALFTIPISIFGIYLLLNRPSNVTQNINKPTTPLPSPTRKTNTNQANNANVNSNVNTANTARNTNQVNSNAVSNATPAGEKTIWKERIEIAPGAHYAVPFELNEDGTIEGTVAAVQGSSIEGYVYTQEQFDEHFPDPIYKVFSIEGEKKAEVKQKLVKEKYVLVFVNKSESSLMIDGSFKIEK